MRNVLFLKNMKDVLKHLTSNVFVLIDPAETNIKDITVIPHLKNSRIKIVINVRSIIECTSLQRKAGLLYSCRVLIKECMRYAVPVFISNFVEDNTSFDSTDLSYRTKEELYYIGTLIGIKNREQIIEFNSDNR